MIQCIKNPLKIMKNSGENTGKELLGSKTIPRLKIANIVVKILISNGTMMVN